jgi:hypothetical protein
MEAVMVRRSSSLVPLPVLLLFLVILFVATPAQAYTTYELNAVSTTSPWTGFTLWYVDFNSDAKFSWDELVSGSFSGVILTTDKGAVCFAALRVEPSAHNFEYPENWVQVDLRDDRSPFFDDLSDESSLFFVAADDVVSPLRVALSGNWTYRQSAVPSAVPLPPSLVLLGSGLLGLVGLRRRLTS